MGREDVKIVLTLVGVIVVASVIGVYSMVSMMWRYGWGSMGGYGMRGQGMMTWGGAGFAWPLWIIVSFTVLIVGIYLVAAGLRQETPREARMSPLETLKARYARGEITESEFKKMRNELME